ncbi:MAG: hypothetical protein ACK5ZH_04070 [Alphaproteobacteria bacterium]
MFWKKLRPLESLSVRHAQVTDGKQVRYFVYRTPTDYVAVIAESALMALKLAEIPSPYKIVRDLPLSGRDALASDRLIPAEIGDKFTLSLTEAPEKVNHVDIPIVKNPLADFSAMKLADLHRHKLKNQFIVTPQQMLEKLAAASAPKPDPAAPVSIPTPAPELVSEPAASPAVDAVADAPLSVEEVGKLLGD